MNKLNYASLEASKRLVDAGIVLETDFWWIRERSAWKLADNDYGLPREYAIPAPSMAEVWRELPHNTWVRKDYSGRTNVMNEDNSFACYNENPTDAIIDLLVWLKGEGMTNEDELAIAHYMNWHYAKHEGIYYYDWGGRRQRNLDLNDAGLVVEEMQKRGEWMNFRSWAGTLWLKSKDSAEDVTAWLMTMEEDRQAKNFFKAFVEWRKKNER